MRGTGKTEVLGENLSECNFVYYKTHVNLPGIEKGSYRWEVRIWKTRTICLLKYITAAEKNNISVTCSFWFHSALLVNFGILSPWNGQRLPHFLTFLMVNAIFFEAGKLQLYVTLHFIVFRPTRLIQRRNIVELLCKKKSEISHQMMIFILKFSVIGRSVLLLAVDRASY